MVKEMTIEDELRKILRSGALGNYMTDGDGNFVPLDWSGTPDSYFDDIIVAINRIRVQDRLETAEKIKSIWDNGVSPPYQLVLLIKELKNQLGESDGK